MGVPPINEGGVPTGGECDLGGHVAAGVGERELHDAVGGSAAVLVVFVVASTQDPLVLSARFPLRSKSQERVAHVAIPQNERRSMARVRFELSTAP